MKKENGKRVLIVDDEESIREFVSYVLTAEGYAVDQVSNGIDALRRCSQAEGAEHYDAVFTDLKMDGMDGSDVVKALRSINPSAFVVVMTGMDLGGSQGVMVKTMADAVLSKPFYAHQIIEIMNSKKTHA